MYVFDYNKISDQISSFGVSIGNDTTRIWNLLRRYYCFKKNQIFIYGDVDLDGKMYPWIERYRPKDNPLENKKTLVYVSGHGTKNGKLIVNKFNNIDIYSIFPKSIWFIVDMCYASESYKKLNHPTSGGKLNTSATWMMSGKEISYSKYSGSIFTTIVCKYIKNYGDERLYHHLEGEGFIVKGSKLKLFSKIDFRKLKN